MYKEPRMQSLFDFDSVNSRDSNEQKTKTELIKPEIEYQNIIKSKTIRDTVISQNNSNPEVIKIVWFYENNSFEEFLPRR
jgi:hypothetical protein